MEIIKCIFELLKGGMTIKENNEIVDRLRELMYTDPDELFPHHQYVLAVDPEELGEGPLANKQTWISRMEVLRLAKETVNETGHRGVNRQNLKTEYM